MSRHSKKLQRRAARERELLKERRAAVLALVMKVGKAHISPDMLDNRLVSNLVELGIEIEVLSMLPPKTIAAFEPPVPITSLAQFTELFGDMSGSLMHEDVAGFFARDGEGR